MQHAKVPRHGQDHGNDEDVDDNRDTDDGRHDDGDDAHDDADGHDDENDDDDNGVCFTMSYSRAKHVTSTCFPRAYTHTQTQTHTHTYTHFDCRSNRIHDRCKFHSGLWYS